MANRDDKSVDSSTAGGEFIWPRPIGDLRPLTVQEIDQLAAALERPIDRNYLACWISTSISNAVRLSALPSPSQCRDGLERLARQGRKWLNQIDDCPGKALLEASNVTALKASVEQFCEGAELIATTVGQLVKPGQTRTPPALTAFLDNMIGIAKRAKILPSTPQRYMETTRPPPAFFVFAEQALAIAQDVILSSPIPDGQKHAALANFNYSSRDALIRIVETLRGQIGNYRESPHGLIEVNDRQT
jgi:hypothetical protein